MFEEITGFVLNCISQKMDIPLIDVCEDSSLYDTLKMDDLDIVELIVEIENEYDITIPDSKATNLRLVSDVIKTTYNILE